MGEETEAISCKRQSRRARQSQGGALRSTAPLQAVPEQMLTGGNADCLCTAPFMGVSNARSTKAQRVDDGSKIAILDEDNAST
nr:hypothetical protein CFP56_11187 [Quercus suber]